MKLLGYEITKARKVDSRAVPPQTREAYENPYFTSFDNSVPFKFNLDLFDALRANIPVLDALPAKIIRLVGTPQFDTNGNQALFDKLQYFSDNVRVGWFQKSLDVFIYQLMDSAIVKGMGFGELIPTVSGSDVHRLKIANAKDMRFLKTDEGLTLGAMDKNQFRAIPIENMDYIYYLAHDTRDGHPQGYSLYYSLPFVSQIYTRMQKSVENTVWRVGDPTFVVSIEGGPGSDYGEISEASSAIQSEVQSALKDRRAGKVRDIFAGVPDGSKIRIDILGAADLDWLEFPMNNIIDQIVSKLPFPAWFLGFHRGTTERLSSNEADMIVANIEWYRKMMDPIIDRILTTYMLLTGDVSSKWSWHWPEVTLRDEVEQAKARQMNAVAAEKETNVLLTLMFEGMLSQDEVEDYLRSTGIKTKGFSPDWYQSKLAEYQSVRIAKQLKAESVVRY